MIIRPLEPRDRDEVHELLVASGAFDGEEIRVALEMVAAPDDYVLFAAEVEGTVRGFAWVGKTPLTLTTWHLYWLGVHPEVQGAGVGRALQAGAESFVRAQGGERLVVETSGRPDYARARRFYRAAGYREAGRIEHYYKPGDCVLFCKLLGEAPPTGHPGRSGVMSQHDGASAQEG